MLMVPPKNLRLHWDAEHGWLLDTPFGVPDDMLRRVVEYAVPRQIDRWRSLPPGDKKKQLRAAIDDLRAGKVRQNIVGAMGNGKGDLIIHSSMKGA